MCSRWTIKRQANRLAILLAASVLTTTPAHAQSATQDPASASNCNAAAPPATPGAGTGGNVFATHIGVPQPADAPNSETATYPDVTEITPDHATPQNIPLDDSTQASPFPFSRALSNPILSTTGGPEISAPPAALKNGC